MDVLYALDDILIPLGICVVLPIVIVWLIMNKKRNETNKRAEIILAAIDKNSDIDTDALLKKLEAQPSHSKTIKERLLNKLLIGGICSALGLGLIIFTTIVKFMLEGITDGVFILYFIGIPLLLIGIVFIIIFYYSKRYLAKELEAEEKGKEKE